jgi:hypothetical protein
MYELFLMFIDGDIEKTLGLSCSRDILYMYKKFKSSSLNQFIKDENVYLFFQGGNSNIYSKNQSSKINIIDGTTENIKLYFDKLLNLLNSVNPENQPILLFHYSGHGYLINNNKTSDKIDNTDDELMGHTMLDKYIWCNFISKMNKKIHFFGFIDACHSGTMTDMPFIYDGINNKWILHKKNNVNCECSGFTIAACSDFQCDSCDIGNMNGFGGALTTAFCDLIDIDKDINFLFHPMNTYKTIIPQLLKLNQNVILSSCKIPV